MMKLPILVCAEKPEN